MTLVISALTVAAAYIIFTLIKGKTTATALGNFLTNKKVQESVPSHPPAVEMIARKVPDAPYHTVIQPSYPTAPASQAAPSQPAPTAADVRREKPLMNTPASLTADKQGKRQESIELKPLYPNFNVFSNFAK